MCPCAETNKSTYVQLLECSLIDVILFPLVDILFVFQICAKMKA